MLLTSASNLTSHIVRFFCLKENDAKKRPTCSAVYAGVMSTIMVRVVGGDLVKIETHQDKKFIKFVVTEFTEASKVHDVIFSNSDGSSINIEFSYIDLGVIYDPNNDTHSLGEFEYVKPFKDGFEVFGDFGIIWIYCDNCSLPNEQYS